MERFAATSAQALSRALTELSGSDFKVTASDLETPPDPKLGDLGFPCFRLAKQFRKGPPQLAAELSSRVAPYLAALTADIEVKPVGPYVNFVVKPSAIAAALLHDILSGTGLGSYGSMPARTRGKWVLEYSSPNVAKPFNIYHLRPTALGAALDRIGRYRGFDLVTINHLGDWGTQYGKLAIAFREYGKDLPANPTIEDLVQIYVKFHAAVESNPGLEDEARKAFLKLEQGDPEMTALWKKCVDISLKEFDRLYARIGVRFDHIWGESHYEKQLAPMLEDLKNRGVLEQSEGAWVAKVTDRAGKEIPPCILQKSDGATIYATRDVAAACFRWEQFHFDRMTYIVGGEQKLHFEQVFGTLRKMGKDWESKCEHVPTGLYRFKDAKMSTRKGNFVTLEEVLEAAKDRVREILKGRENLTLSGDALETMAEQVAIGAVIFHDLHSDPARDVEFDVDRVVDFEGETGPYLQYAHTRCLSILRKARETGELAGEVQFSASFSEALSKDEEFALLKQLGQFGLHLERSLTHGKASQLAHYLIDVTQAFGSFYRECKVLGEGARITGARLMLVEATRRILGQGMALLGVPAPERM
jgi:arginyl-tRNA synthetase